MKNVIVLGILGSGKSQLCNFLDGDVTNSKYKVGDSNYAQTQIGDIINQDEKGLIILKNKYCLIDSCGGDEDCEKDLDNLKEYTEYLQKKGAVHCILYVFNYRTRNAANSVKDYLKKLSLIFTPKEFYEHLIIILTNFPENPKTKDIKKRDIYKDELNDMMKEAFNIKDTDQKKAIYFIDTDPNEDENGPYFIEKQKQTRDDIIKEIVTICINTPPIMITKYLSNINAMDKRNNIGEYYYYKIKGSNEGFVWGYGIYTDDSNISKAAILEGKCKLGEEKIVKIKIEKSYSNYPGVYKNGIKSNRWSYWPGSYIFVNY